MSLSQQAKKWVTVLARWHGKLIGLLLHDGFKKEYVWNTGDFLGHLLVLPYLMVRVDWRLQQSNSGKTANGSNPSRMKVWDYATKGRTMTNCGQRKYGVGNGRT